MNYHVLEKAQQALLHYIYLMTGETHRISVTVEPGLFQVDDAALDDAYQAHIDQGRGSIIASNPRAALIAVYHVLRENGCAFVRPGSASERIPRKPLDSIAADLDVKAAHRFRGLCIEGSCNLENTLDLLEWMPKVGFNCYFMQFREGYNFFQRWYKCTSNQAMSPWEFNLEVCRSIIPQIVWAAHENGLIYHAVGHGFTCECFGVSGLGWIEMDNWPKEAEWALAQRNGVRDLALHMPLISALCYSNVRVQEIVVDAAVEYIAQHPELDYIHFWLDDGNNNKCECESCRDTRVADSYVQMLNLLDEKLTARSIEKKIVFLAYHELLWPPLKEKIKNPSRFVFMFAPIQRSFLHPLPKVGSAGEMPPYTLNHQPFPEDNHQMMAHLKAWNEYRSKIGMDFDSSFVFDYYCNDFNDPGQYIQARLLYEDIRNLKSNGLGGLINCQAQRAFDHAALPMYVMARTLVQPELSLEAIADEFFYGAFGEDYKLYHDRWLELTEKSSFLREQSQIENVEELLSVLEKPLPDVACKDLTTSHSRKLMRFSLDLYCRLARMVSAHRNGDEASVNAIHAEIDRYTSEKECEFAQEFDRKYFSEAEDRLLQPSCD